MYEWALDWYASPYPTTNCTNCANLTAATGRVIRGGSWGLSGAYLTTAFRDNYAPDYHNLYSGFRCSRTP